MPTVEELVYNMILFLFLPLWILCGGFDYWCHRKTKIEENSGVKESVQHCLMGIQVGVPMFMIIYLEMTVLVLCQPALLHEITTHRALVYAEGPQDYCLGATLTRLSEHNSILFTDVGDCL